jgi:hypothetical protein
VQSFSLTSDTEEDHLPTVNATHASSPSTHASTTPKLVAFAPAELVDLGYGDSVDLKKLLGSVPAFADWKVKDQKFSLLEGHSYNATFYDAGMPKAAIHAMWDEVKNVDDGAKPEDYAFQNLAVLYDASKKLVGFMVSCGNDIASGNVFVTADGKKTDSVWAD